MKIYRVDTGWVVADDGGWLPGVYATWEDAATAVRDAASTPPGRYTVEGLLRPEYDIDRPRQVLSCRDCGGALVVDTATHDRWHATQNRDET